MPRQLTLLGRPIPRIGHRHITLILTFTSILALISLATLTGSVADYPALSDGGHQHKISGSDLGHRLTKSILRPFLQPTQSPPRQKNDEYGGSSWWSDWKWLSVPFSSSLTLDQDRALLPPLRDRPPVYCYYDSTLKKPRDEKDAESDLLLTWKRAWWAQGFRPVILGPAEAMKNPSYDKLQRMEAGPALKSDVMRWLAWDTMGGGLLSGQDLFPMAHRDDSLLEYLRRAEDHKLTHWEDLGDSLLAGQATDVNSAVQTFMESSSLQQGQNVMTLLSDDALQTDDVQVSLAHYTSKTIQKKYAKIASVLSDDRARGLRSLNKLINAHLHITWQNSFPEGIEVLKPLAKHTTTMISGSLDLGKALATCSQTPMPSSCPPNRPKCSPCVAIAGPMNVATPAHYHNSTRVFSVGTVPHPWTLAMVSNLRDTIDIEWIRNESERDGWLAVVTQLLPGGATGHHRIMHFKEAVAGDRASSNTIWLIAEEDLPTGLDWHFGFAIPEGPMDDGKSLSPVPADRLPDKSIKPLKSNGPVATEKDLELEAPLLDKAKAFFIKAKSPEEVKLRASLEAWNMADTEAWKFARAYLARQTMEWEEWEKEEVMYSQWESSTLSRWQDKPGDGS